VVGSVDPPEVLLVVPEVFVGVACVVFHPDCEGHPRPDPEEPGERGLGGEGGEGGEGGGEEGV